MSAAAKVGIVMLIALGVAGYFVIKIEDIDFNRSKGTREVKAIFDDVAGLEDESTVRIAGVRKGHVTKVRALPDGTAEVTMEVDDDVPLHADASARVANLGLLGEKYIELEPGSAKSPVLNTRSVVVRGSAPVSFDEITTQMSTIAEDVKAITSSLRTVMAGPQGQQRLIDIVENVRLITGEVRTLIATNRENVDATMANAREITAHLRVEIPRLAASIDRVANQLGGTVGENRAEVREIVANLRNLSSDLRVTADNLNAVTGRVRAGEGTVGKLLSSDEAHDKLTSALGAVESGVTELRGILGRAAKMQLELGIKADYLAGMAEAEEVNGVRPDFGGSSRSSVSLRLTPNPEGNNRFYNVALSDDPRGKRRDRLTVETTTDPATGQSRTTITEQTRYQSDFVISAQAGWILDESLSVRVGLFESTGGVGADYRWNDRLTVTGEAFDFGQRRDDLPHIRLFGEYTLRQEKEKTPRIFVTTGVENALNDTAFILGGGLRWKDEDLKYLLGSIPLGR